MSSLVNLETSLQRREKEFTSSSMKFLSYSQNIHSSSCPIIDRNACTMPNRGDNSSKDDKHNFFRMSRRAAFVLVMCTLTNFVSGCTVSLPAPFYPQEAMEEKEMSQTLVGIVFSVYNVMIMISSPLIGNNLVRIGPSFVYLSSVFIGSMSTALFGTLHYCSAGAGFVVISFLCRAIQGVAYAGFVNATFAIVAAEFPQSVATAFSIIETGTNIGFMSGPVIGGAIYDLGGFAAPFLTLGGMFLVCGFLLYCFLPTPKQMDKKRQSSVGLLFTSPMILIPISSIFMGSLGVTFLQPTLSGHLSPFGLSSFLTGVVFFVQPFLSAITGPFWGYLTDYKGILGSSLIVGHFLTALGFFIAGHVIPFIPLNIWTVVTGLSLFGLTYEVTLLPTMKCMLIGALSVGFEDNIDTYGLLAAVLNIFFYMGGIVGPLIGGSLDFKTGSVVVGCLNLVVMLVCLIFFLIRSKNQKR